MRSVYVTFGPERENKQCASRLWFEVPNFTKCRSFSTSYYCFLLSYNEKRIKKSSLQ